MSDQQLQKYFEFDDADLEANRKGRLTPNQLARLGKEAKAQTGCSIALGVLLLGVAILPIPILYFTGALEFFGAAGLVWAIWPLAWGAVAFFLIRGAFSKPDYTLMKVQGPINIVKTESYSSSTHTTSYDYELHVGGQAFDVESDLADYMMQGDVYTIYFTKEPEEIVSVEKVANAR